jgi:amino acid adenylation domain-containing protein
MEQATYSIAEYWLERLSGVNELRLPTFAAEKNITVNLPVSAEEMLQIRKIAGDKDLNVLKLFIGGLGILLWKYAAQNDILISMPPMALPDVDVAASGALHCRLNVQEDAPVRTFFSQVHEAVSDAYANSEYDETELLAAFAQANDGSVSALKNIAFKYSKLSAEGNWLDEHAVVFDFAEGDAACISCTSRNSLYPARMLQNMAESLLMLVLQFPANKEKQVGECSIVPEARWQQWYAQFEKNSRNYPKDVTVVDPFLQNAAQTPTKTALIFDDHEISYDELNKWSERIASFIIASLPKQKDLLIGIMMERTPALVATVLGILRAGAAYVPIDSNYPADRMHDILTDSACPLVLTDDNKIPVEVEGCRFVNIQSITSAVECAMQLPAPKDLAYIIYSSGTTGKPKGIMMEHGAIMNLLFWYNERYGINENTRIVQLTNIVIDIAFQEIFSSLMNGLTLYMPVKDESQDKQLFIDYLNKNKINFIQLIPDMLSEYLLDIPKLPHLELVLCGGDKLSDNLKDAIVEKGYRLFNIYGQTETAIDTVGALCEYGVPMRFNEYLPHYDVLIMDGLGNLCPEFIPGEIYTAGEGLARGYVNQPELTAQKFIEHPLRKGERIYRTGDVARRLPDGSLELMGRKDDQVKIRGFRVELAEIEAALRKHPHVEAAVVLALQKEQDKQLAAYIVGSSALSAPAIRAYLSQSLPAYMLPAHFVQLNKLPLTPSGKVDRRKLPDPEGISLATGVQYAPPRNELEQGMVKIWQELLGKEKIGIKDDFFESGGDSIKILRLMSELKKALGIKVSFADIYEHGTIEKISGYIHQNRDDIDRQTQKANEKEVLAREQIAALKERVFASGNIDTTNIEDVYPMSDIEKGIVYESLLHEGSGIYHDVAVHERIFPAFDLQRFRLALKLMMEKHSILRTSFNLNDFETEVQLVNRNTDVPVHYQDLVGLQRQEQENIIREYIASELRDPFRFSIAPLWRITVFNCGHDEVVFVTQSHHSIIDGWSDASFMTELNNLYMELAKDPLYRPAPLRSTYKDFIVRHETDKNDDAIKGFWQQELEGHTKLDLFAGDEVQSFAQQMDAAFIQKLDQAAVRLGAPVKIIALAAYMQLLRTLNYGNEVIAGLVTNTRPDCEDGDKILGCFLNTVPLRLIMPGDATGAELVRLVNNKVIGLKQYERLSMLEIAQLHNMQTNEGNPFFDVIFNYVDFHAYDSIQNSSSNNRSAAANLTGNGITNTYLDLDINRTGGEFSICFRFNKKLKSGISPVSLCEYYCNILSSIIGHPDQQPECMDVAEKQRQLIDFAGAAQEYPKDKTLLYLFDEQVSAKPASIALIVDDREFTYAQLNESANQLADHLLKNHAVKPGDLIGIRLERTEWMIISMLGTLKSGAAYVPIDVAYPQERIDYIVADSKCKVVIDNTVLDAFRKEQDNCSRQNIPVINRSADLAYIIYTSGSTGKPKGVMIEHRNAVSFINWSIAEFMHSPFDIVFAATSICFDLSIFEIFYTLSIGKKLRLLGNALSIPQYLQSHKNILLNTVPGAVGALLGQQVDWSNVTVLNMAGEPVPQQYLSQLDCERMEVRNLYGPSEDTTYSTGYRMKSDAPVLIGRPLANTQVYILDVSHHLVPIGVTGEICISGDCLARGYLNQPLLTAEKFVTNPLHPEIRMYKTGDLGRWRPDGNIEYLGRKDDQVKVRGFRIELGEIEISLRSMPEIDAAVVIAKAMKSTEKELIAYITGAAPVSVQDIRTHLGRLLPAYMVPAYFVQLDALPVTPNGKIDRKKLPDPLEHQVIDHAAYVAPRNEQQRKLVTLMEEILGRKNISLRDNFFDLGGHSLQAMKLIGILNKQHGFNLKIQDIYNQPTIEELFFGGSTGSGMMRLNRYDANAIGNLYFVPPIFGNAVIFKSLADKMDRQFNCYGFQYSGLAENEPEYSSVEEIAGQFSNEILNHHVKGEVVICGYSMGVAIAFEIAKTLEQKGIPLTLILVDRGIPSKIEMFWRRVTAGIAANQLFALYKKLTTGIQVNEKLLKKFLLNNIKVLNRYQQAGKLISKIYVFESEQNRQNMGNWKTFTTAGISHSFVKGSHLEALTGDNTGHVASTILSVFKS